jgi:hypothetical protein
MPVYSVTRKSDAVEVYRYESPEPIEWFGMEFSTHDHIAQAEPVPSPELSANAWHLYPGPFKDRLGMDGLAIAASAHPVCLAVREMLSGRLYIDLKNPKVSGMLDMLIASGQPEAHPAFPGSGPMTVEKKQVILGVPAGVEEAYRG